MNCENCEQPFDAFDRQRFVWKDGQAEPIAAVVICSRCGTINEISFEAG